MKVGLYVEDVGAESPDPNESDRCEVTQVDQHDSVLLRPL